MYVRLEEHFSRGGSLKQVQQAADQAKKKSPEEMGIRVSMRLPHLSTTCC